MANRVLCVGYCTLDQIGLVEHFARDDEAVEMPTFSHQGGGTAATAAVAMARWGTSTGFVGKVGGDDRGDHIERTLTGEGVDTDEMIREPSKISQLRFVIVEASSRTRHTYFTPGNVTPLLAEEVDVEWVDDRDLLVVDGEYPRAQAKLMARAQSQGIPVVLEANQDRAAVDECIEYADVVVASEREASAFTGVGSLEGICEAFLEFGPEQAVVTLGNEGAVALGRESDLVRNEALDIDMVDPTGAADVFLGGIAFGVLQDWSLDETVKFANAAAGWSCTGPGGRSTIARREKLEELAGI